MGKIKHKKAEFRNDFLHIIILPQMFYLMLCFLYRYLKQYYKPYTNIKLVLWRYNISLLTQW